MERRGKPTALTQGFRYPSALTHAERYAINYLQRWGTMFGKPRTMSALQARGLVEQCGSAGPQLPQWRLTQAGRDFVV